MVSDVSLLRPPVNVLRLSLSPGGLAPHIVNFAEWRSHLLDRLRQQIEVTADAQLDDLLRELLAFPVAVSGKPDQDQKNYAGVLIPMQLRTPAGIMSFFSTTTVFGTPVDITLSEIALEAFFPADAATAEALRLAANS
jgi:hypothetical protein